MKRIVVLLAMVLCALAAFSAMAVETSAGEKVVVPIYVDTPGAFQISLAVSFDTDLFEYSSIRCEGPGGQATYNATTQQGKMVMYDINGCIEAGRVGTITLVVKDDVALGIYDISVRVLEAWDLDENAIAIDVSAEDIIVKCPHKECETVYNVEPDCENEGEVYRVCLACGEIAEKLLVTELGHLFGEWEVVKAPTCTMEGEEKLTCQREGCMFEDVRGIPSPGHARVTLDAVAPTCEQDGLTDGEYCDVCKEVFVEQLVIPATGHNIVEDKAVEATCTKDGLTAGSHCSNCENVMVIQTVIPATGHDDGEWVITVQPTTEEAGIKERRCTVCQDVLDIKAVPPLEKAEEVADPVVATIEAKIDDTVTLNVFVSSNKAAVVKVQLNYDADTFEFVSEYSGVGLVKDGQYLIYSLVGIINGNIGTITLKVKDTAEDGLNTVSATVVEAFDFDENPVVAKAAVDKVDVIIRIPGDVTGDGLVDGRDLLRLAKHIGGYDVIVFEKNATVNGDDAIDGRDLLRLAKFIGGYDVELQ